MVERPSPRDNDAMATLLESMRRRLDRLEARPVLPVGKSWRVEEQASTGDLVATLPALNRSVLLASPNGECGAPLDCVGGAVDDTMVFDPDDRSLGVRVSVDADNALTTGGDGGLWVPPSTGAADTVTFSGPNSGAGRAAGDVVAVDDALDHPGVWAFPGDAVYGPPFTPAASGPAGFIQGAWIPDPDGGRIHYTDVNCHPGVGFGIKFNAYTYPAGSSGIGFPSIAWYLAPWNEWGVPFLRPGWCGDTVTVDMTWHFTDTIDPIAVPAGGGAVQQVPLCLFNFYPGASVYLWGRQLVALPSAAFASHSPATTADMVFSETPYPAYDPVGRTFEPSVRGSWVPTGELIRFRVVLSRKAGSVVYLYLGDVERPDEDFDSFIPLSRKWPMNFDDGASVPPFFEFGQRIPNNRFITPYAGGARPSISIPEMTVSNLRVTLDVPPGAHFPPPPT